MSKRHLMLESPAMGRRIHIWCYGHFGTPMIAFPTAAGYAHEWEDKGMVKVLAPLLEAGHLKLYCPESNVSETLNNPRPCPKQQIRRHLAYEQFVTQTLVPFIYEDCKCDALPIALAGASLGAYYACTFALKFPQLFYYAMCMSGRYDLSAFTGHTSNADIYFNNPLAFVHGLKGQALAQIQQHTRFSLVCGRGAFEDECIEETAALAQLFSAKQIPHKLDWWGADVAHDWVWWQQQICKNLCL